MTENERHWLAGLLQGDGSFTMINAGTMRGRGYKRVRSTAYVCLEMSEDELDVVERAATLMCAPSAYRYPPRQRTRFPNAKGTARAQVGGEKAVRLMRDLYPLLGSRRRARIDEILAACDPDGTRYAARTKEEAA